MGKNKRGCSEVKISVTATSADLTPHGYPMHPATILSIAHCNQLIFDNRVIIVYRRAWIQVPAVTLSMHLCSVDWIEHASDEYGLQSRVRTYAILFVASHSLSHINASLFC
jgi:hypothetical protein